MGRSLRQGKAGFLGKAPQGLQEGGAGENRSSGNRRVGFGAGHLLEFNLRSPRHQSREQEALVAQLRHPDPDTAVRTLEDIRARGWLVDGTLQGAHLQGANLQGAWLARATLQHTWLMGADLRRANLYAAILRGADLYKANLAGASLEAAIFDPNTVLPDGSRWSPDASLFRFTDPPQPAFHERR